MEKDAEYKKGLKRFLQTMGANLHTLRMRNGDDIETVAEIMKVAPSLLRRIERGDLDDVEIDLIQRLSLYYNVSPKAVATEHGIINLN
jgi:transcriptional regulator with XRE-family HTH domain